MNQIIERIFEDTKLDKKTLVERALKGTEEMGEVAEAVLSYANAHGCGYKNKNVNDVIEECIDVIIIGFSLINHVQNFEVDMDLVRNIFNKKLTKWEEKSK